MGKRRRSGTHMMNQLAPSETTLNVWYWVESVTVVAPSIVWLEVVATVTLLAPLLVRLIV